MRPVALVALGALVALALAGCAEGDPGADGDVGSLGALVPAPLADELTESGTCPSGVLWVADDAGSLAVTVEIRPGGADLDGADLPSPAIVVEAVRDDDPCDPAADSRSPAAEGRIQLDREGGCVTAFEIDGLETEDGTPFPPIDWTPAGPAC